MIKIDGADYEQIEDPKYGITCLFPTEGEGSIEAITKRYGDDKDVLMQSAAYFVVANGRGDFSALEDGDHRPLTLSPAGDLVPARDGDKFFMDDGDDDVLFATKSGWQDGDENVECFGARVP